jgi:hypothetical protein
LDRRVNYLTPTSEDSRDHDCPPVCLELQATIGFGAKISLNFQNSHTDLRPRNFTVTFLNHKELTANPLDQSINMADAPRGGAAARGGGFGSRGGERGGDRGDRGRGRGRRGPRRGANKNEEKEWQPVTKLGRLVKDGKIKSMEEIYLHSLPIKEYQIVDFFLPKLKDEVMKVGAATFNWCIGQTLII